MEQFDRRALIYESVGTDRIALANRIIELEERLDAAESREVEREVSAHPPVAIAAAGGWEVFHEHHSETKGAAC